MPGSPLSLKLALYKCAGPPPSTQYFTLTALWSLSFTGHSVFFNCSFCFLWLTSYIFSLAQPLILPNQNHPSSSPVLISLSQSTPYPASGEAPPLPWPPLSLHPVLWPQTFPIKFLGSIMSELICSHAWVNVAGPCPRQDARLIRIVHLLCPL